MAIKCDKDPFKRIECLLIARLRNRGKVIHLIGDVEALISGLLLELQAGNHKDFTEKECDKLARAIKLQDKSQTLPEHRKLLNRSIDVYEA